MIIGTLSISSRIARFDLVLGFHKIKEFILEKTRIFGFFVPGSN
jgi:hypothetical protein